LLKLRAYAVDLPRSTRDAVGILQLLLARRCTNLHGHGGAKYDVSEVRDRLRENRFVLKRIRRCLIFVRFSAMRHALLLIFAQEP
jgi:hypothetical protein